MKDSETPQALLQLERLLDEYSTADGLDPARRDRLIENIRSEAQAAGVEQDLGLDDATSAAEAITRMGRGAARRFAQLDANKDGFVTLEEFLAAGRTLLVRSDRNGDGRITWVEFKATTPVR